MLEPLTLVHIEHNASILEQGCSTEN